MIMSLVIWVLVSVCCWIKTVFDGDVLIELLGEERKVRKTVDEIEMERSSKSVPELRLP